MRLRLLLPLLLLLALLVACGDDDTSTSDGTDDETDDRTEDVDVELDDNDSDDVLLSVSTGGGYLPEITASGEFPSFLLFGDGTVVQPVETEDDDFEDQPLLPELESQQLTEDGVNELIEAALDAGVDSDTEFGEPDITDLATTVVEIDAGDVDEEVAVYALGDTEGVSDDEEEAREDLSEFLDDLEDLDDVVGDEVADPEAYSPEGWLVSSEVTEESPDSGPGEADAQLVEPWPLDPEEAGEPDGGVTCTEVTGENDVEDFEDALDGVVEGTQFEVRPETLDLTYRVIVSARPVLTGSEDCDD